MTKNANIIVVNNTQTAETARQKHGLSETMTRLLGRGLAAAQLIASFHKQEERIILNWSAQGPMQVRFPRRAIFSCF